jgi:hypothetical protein
MFDLTSGARRPDQPQAITLQTIFSVTMQAANGLALGLLT